MKSRIISAVLGLTLAAWLPLAALQSSPDPAKPDAKAQCSCCAKDAQPGSASAAKQDHSAMRAKSASGKAMNCCKSKSKYASAKLECCKDHDPAICAAKDGKSCCESKDGKACCTGGANAVACNSKGGKACCDSRDSGCCKRAA